MEADGIGGKLQGKRKAVSRGAAEKTEKCISLSASA